jgi:hypothetical protein
MNDDNTYSYTRLKVSQSYLGPSDYLSELLTSKQTNKQTENYDLHLYIPNTLATLSLPSTNENYGKSVKETIL